MYGEAETERLLDDLRCVGPGKPMGYLPISTMENCGWTVEHAIAYADGKGIRSRCYTQDEGRVGSGAVFFWDHDLVQRFLDLNPAILRRVGWPEDAEGFVARSVVELAEDRQLYELIGVLYADARMISPRATVVPLGFVPFDREPRPVSSAPSPPTR